MAPASAPGMLRAPAVAAAAVSASTGAVSFSATRAGSHSLAAPSGRPAASPLPFASLNRRRRFPASYSAYTAPPSSLLPLRRAVLHASSRSRRLAPLRAVTPVTTATASGGASGGHGSGVASSGGERPLAATTTTEPASSGGFLGLRLPWQRQRGPQKKRRAPLPQPVLPVAKPGPIEARK